MWCVRACCGLVPCGLVCEGHTVMALGRKHARPESMADGLVKLSARARAIHKNERGQEDGGLLLV